MVDQGYLVKDVPGSSLIRGHTHLSSVTCPVLLTHQHMFNASLGQSTKLGSGGKQNIHEAVSHLQKFRIWLERQIVK